MRRRRQPNRATIAAALICAALVVSSCGAQVWGSPPPAESAPAETAAAPPVTSAVPQTTPARPPASFDGLDARTRQAAADAADSGATIGVVVLDRDTGETVSNRADQVFPIASVVKLFIADDLLLQESKGELKLTAAERKSLDQMLRSSDDSAAQTFWDRSGGSAIITRIVARYGLTDTTPPYNGSWDVTQSTPSDIVRYYDKLLDGSGGLPAEQANVIIDNLARFTPTGLDGYPQRFGIPDGLDADTVAVKQGWFCCWNGSNQLHMSTGAIGSDRRYVMAIGSLQPVSEAAARDTMTEFVRTMFPNGEI